MPHKIYKCIWRFCFLFSILLLTACGFHLQGFHSIPRALNPLCILNQEPYSDFTLGLKQQLQSVGMDIVASPSQARYCLHITKIDTQPANVTISENTQIRTYLIQTSMSYEILDSHQNLVVPEKTLTEQSTYSTNDNQLLGDQEIFNSEKRELYHLLFLKLQFQLNSRSVKEKLYSYEN